MGRLDPFRQLNQQRSAPINKIANHLTHCPKQWHVYLYNSKRRNRERDICTNFFGKKMPMMNNRHLKGY